MNVITQRLRTFDVTPQIPVASSSQIVGLTTTSCRQLCEPARENSLPSARVPPGQIRRPSDCNGAEVVHGQSAEWESESVKVDKAVPVRVVDESRGAGKAKTKTGRKRKGHGKGKERADAMKTISIALALVALLVAVDVRNMRQRTRRIPRLSQGRSHAGAIGERVRRSERIRTMQSASVRTRIDRGVVRAAVRKGVGRSCRVAAIHRAYKQAG